MRPHLLRAALCAALLALPAAHAHAAPPAGELTWYGQSCFLLETAAGTRIVMDPIPKGIGYELPQGLKADVVTISHEHYDHNNVAFVTGKSRVNTAWGYGPYFDQPFDMEGDQYAVYADDTPIPTGTCDYGTITT